MRQHATIADPSDALGRRVLVRYQLHGESYAATDVLGNLEAFDDENLTVVTRDGAAVAVRRADIVALKVIPPQTVTRRDVRDLEGAAALAWQALDVDHLGGWLLRASGGFTGRANSCLPLDDPGMPMPDAVTAVENWYVQRGLVPLVQIPVPLGRVIEPLLDARGWAAPHSGAIVMTGPIHHVVESGRRRALPDVHVADRPDDAFLANYHYRGGTLPPHAIDVLSNADTVGFAGVDEDGERVAVARGAVTYSPKGRRWLGVTAVEVAEHARRRGLASHVTAGIATWAAEHGATDVYVQVAPENAPAIAAYERLGLLEHHQYHYRRLP